MKFITSEVSMKVFQVQQNKIFFRVLNNHYELVQLLFFSVMLQNMF